MSVTRGKPLGMGKKTTTLHLRVSVEEMNAWVAEAYRIAKVEGWPASEAERPFSKWVRRTLNASVLKQGGGVK